MTGETSRREQALSVFLSLLMIGSVLAIGGAAFAGSAAAQQDTITVDKDDGSNYDTIQNAVDNASTGDTIEVTPGTYNESVTVDVANVTLVSSEGPKQTVITDPNGHKEVVEVTASNVTVDGFTVTSGGTVDSNYGTYGIRVIPRSGNINNVTVKNNILKNISDVYRAVGISVSTGKTGNQLQDITVENNTVYDIETTVTTRPQAGNSIAKGITQNGAVSRSEVINNDITDIGGKESAAAHGITLDGGGPTDFTVSNNQINLLEINRSVPENDPYFDDKTAIIVGGFADLGDDHSVHSNNILDGQVYRYNAGKDTDTLNATNNWWGSASGPAADTNTHNDTSQGAAVSGRVEFTPWLNASTDNGGQSFAPVTNDSEGQFASIQSAVDAADAGDTIEVEPGTYSGFDVTNTANLTIRASAGASPEVDATTQVRLASANTTVQGLTFDLNSGVIYIRAPNGEFTENVVEVSNASNHGIRAERAPGVQIRDNDFSVESDDSPFTQGLLLSGTQDARVIGNTLNGPEADDPTGADAFGSTVAPDAGIGIYVTSKFTDARNLTIRSNSISGFGQGILLNENDKQISAVTLEDNDVSASAYDDFLLVDTTGDDGFDDINGEQTTNAQIDAILTDNPGIETTTPGLPTSASLTKSNQNDLRYTVTASGSLTGLSLNRGSLTGIGEGGDFTARSNADGTVSYTATVDDVPDRTYQASVDAANGQPFPGSLTSEPVTVTTSTSISLNISANRTAVTAGDPVQFTVTNAADGTPIENAAVALPNKTVRTDAEGTVVSTVDTPGTVTVRTTGNQQDDYVPDTVDLNVTATASPTDVRVENGSLQPNQATAGTTNDHQLTITVSNLSADGDTDELTVTLPESTSISGASTTVTDAEGQPIQVTSSTSITGPSNNAVTLAIAPEESSNTSRVTLNVTLTGVAAPNVTETQTVPVTATVDDSVAGPTGPTRVAQLTVVNDTDSPLSGPAGEYDDDGDANITAAELGDAVTQFAQENLTASELGEVVTAYAQS